jgi:DNA-binding response OmpR family regulator
MERWKVLLVDDEAEFAATLAERLTLRGMDARVASRGEEALQLLQSDPPHLVVLDVMMPGLGGMEVLRRIKRQYPKIQVVLLTGMTAAVEVEEARRLGAFDCLMKPLRIEELIRVIGEAIAASGVQHPKSPSS